MDSSSVPDSSWPLRYCVVGQRAFDRKSLLLLAMDALKEDQITYLCRANTLCELSGFDSPPAFRIESI